MPAAASKLPPRVMGLGHPLLDIMSHVNHDYLDRFNVPLGSCNLAQPEQLPIFEEVSQRRDVEFVPGGAAMNTIRVIQWLSKGSVSTTFVGSLGDDEFGGILERALVLGGVAPVFEYHDEKPTGTCACLIVDAERSLLANLGSAIDLTMKHITSNEVMEEISRSTLYYCEGFLFNTVSSPKAALLIGQHSIDHDKCFCFNLSAPYLCHIFKEQWMEVIPFIDILFGSRIDAEAFCEANEWGTKELKDIMTRIADLPKRNAGRQRLVVITGGSGETFVATREGFWSYKPLAVPPEEIVDTNGAGDSFVGGFLTMYAKGSSIEDCVNAGHAAAAIIIRHNGCTFPEKPPEKLC